MSKIFELKTANAPWMEHQGRLNQKTLHCYENLSEIKRKELVDWLQVNLFRLPIPIKIKTTGFEKLLSGQHHYPLALLLIRQAIKKLNPEILF